MRLVIKLLFLLLVLGLFAPLWMKDPAGRPVMTLDDYVSLPRKASDFIARRHDVLQAAAPATANNTGAASQLGKEAASVPGAELQYYRWQDESGVWHFSDEPPPEGANAQLAVLPEVSNSMQAPPVQRVDSAGTAIPADSKLLPAVKLPEGVSQEAIEQTLEQAHQRRMGDEL